MRTYDLVIIGAGPAGMTAAVYGVRANLKVLMLDTLAPGGNVLNTNVVDNYPALPGTNGAELAIQMFEHTQSLDVEFENAGATRIEDKGDTKLVYLDSQEEPIEALTVLIASGTTPRKLRIPGEAELEGKNIHWCAICDGAKYRGKDVILIGGGNSAVDEGTYLAGIVKSLTIVTDFDLTGDPASNDYLRSLPNVTVYPYKIVKEFLVEDGHLKGLRFVDKENPDKETVVYGDGAFEYIGLVPVTEFTEGLGLNMDRGYIEVNEFMETNIPGIYAGGDCTSKWLRQIVTACNDGSVAAQRASAYKKAKMREGAAVSA